MSQRGSLVERLKEVLALLGLVQTHPNPALTEMAGICGYDFLMLDAEHGVFSEQDYLLALQALRSTAMSAFVRLAGHDAQAIGRYLDMGVDGFWSRASAPPRRRERSCARWNTHRSVRGDPGPRCIVPRATGSICASTCARPAPERGFSR